ncbi:MAG: purine-nucleoside phosphorylase [Saprospiraceae bacterium]|nr:purine-nucleoside phosphorylase [Saprospiraceae bacterium]MCB9322194.1 purine-nucleoside phosphorylase [Lewinellaceae bacterium]
MDYLLQIKEATAYISSRTSYRPKIGLILGSGLGELADTLESPEHYRYEDIPNFAVSTVPGHSGKLVMGKLEGVEVVAMQGRIHYYEGYSMKQVTFPVRVMKNLGVEVLIVTNACGGLNEKLYVGALMLIRDHINMMPENPLRGINFDELGPRFPDMLQAYDKELITIAQEVANEIDLEIFTGVHCAVTGPTFETHAEMHMLKVLGADTVGMSTIPEAIVARHAGMRVLGISAVTDMSGMEEVSHESVILAANEIKPRFIKLVRGVVKKNAFKP